MADYNLQINHNLLTDDNLCHENLHILAEKESQINKSILSGEPASLSILVLSPVFSPRQLSYALLQ